MNKDLDHLRTLSIFHFIAAGLSVLGACFGLLYVALGLAMATGKMPAGQAGQEPPPELGWLLFGMGVAFFVVGLLYSIGMVIVGLRLMQQRAYVFCIIMAAMTCIVAFPIGTILGVFTIVVLVRPTVKALFESQKARTRDPAWEAG